MNIKKKLFLIAGALFSLFCLYLAFKGISLPEVLRAFRQVQVQWIAGAMVVYTFGFFLRTWRWKLLLAPIKPFAMQRLFPILIIGFFSNNILPLRMGEFLRAHISGIRLRVSRVATFGTILLERLFDTVSFLATFSVSALLFPFPPKIEKAATFVAVACIGMVVALLLALYFHSAFDALLKRLPIRERWIQAMREALEKFLHGLSSLKTVRGVLSILSLSLLIWIIEGTVLYGIVRAFNVPFQYPEAFFLLFFLGLSVMVPQGPGYVGTMELFGVTALGLLGISKDMGLPIILCIHACQFLFVMWLGFWALWHEGLSLRSLSQMNESQK